MTRGARRPVRRHTAPRLGSYLLIAAGLLATAGPAPARILKTKRPSQYKELALTIGSGVEHESDSEQSQYDFPFLIEYGLTRALTLTVEPNYVAIHDRVEGSSVRGFGDLETGVTYEFLRERRNRPTLSAEWVAKWPTAKSDELGTGKADYSVGAIVSKESFRFDLDFETLYTFVGSPAGVPLQNTIETGLAGEWHLNRVLDLEFEIVTSSGGGFHGRTGGIGGIGGSVGAAEPGGRETEGTLGLAERLGDHLKLEQGLIRKSGGSWQVVVAWEWDFAEGR